MSKTDIWLPWYPADYLKDTLHLTLEEDGFYRRALDQIWICRGRLPVDPKRISLLLRISDRQMKRCSWILDKHFYRIGEEYGHRRCDIELAKSQEKANIARNNGNKGGRPPIQKETQRVISGIPTANPDYNPEKSSSHSPSHSHKKGEREPRTREDFQITKERAEIVLQIYPSKAKKDGRPIAKSQKALSHLIAKISEFPAYDWENHAKMMNFDPTPQNLEKWVESMPDEIALGSLRKAFPASQPAKARPDPEIEAQAARTRHEIEMAALPEDEKRRRLELASKFLPTFEEKIRGVK